MFSKYFCILVLLGSSLALPIDKDDLLQRFFDKLDQDGNGEVTQVEVLSVLKSFGLTLTAADVDEFLYNLDNIDFDTFLQITRVQPTDAKARIPFAGLIGLIIGIGLLEGLLS